MSRNDARRRPSVPRLVVVAELEGRAPRARLSAETFEDELALRAWLRRSSTLEQLASVTESLLDVLDELEEAA